MATNLITIPVYGINSDQKFSVMKELAFPATGLFAQPVAPPLNNINGNLIYSQITSSVTGTTAFYSNLTVAAVISLANA